jgi:hypothetical protein
VDGLAQMVADELDRWGVGGIERLLFGTSDASLIAATVSELCRANFGCPVSHGLFYRGSAGAVFGVALDDGRELVLKVFQPRWTAVFLSAVQAVQSHLAAGGYPCPDPILPPTEWNRANDSLITAETVLVDPGMRPLVAAERTVAAHGLAEQIARCSSMTLPGLTNHPLTASHESLYPEPHSPLFDFRATASGADWIDRFAVVSKAVREEPAPSAVAHMDWSSRNLRIQDGRLVAVYDWDSVTVGSEAVAVGQAAVTWSVTSEPDGSRFPDTDDIVGFIIDYERAAGRQFTAQQWRAIGASATWLLAYTARCEHALDMTGTARPDQDGARHRLAHDGTDLLELEHRRPNPGPA